MPRSALRRVELETFLHAEPSAVELRPMRVTNLRLVPPLCALLPATGCGPDIRSGTGSCSLDGTVVFQDRAYIPTKAVPGLKGRKPQMDEHLEVGETAACPGREPHKVQVFKVVGVSPDRAVHTGASYGLMVRADSDAG